MWLRAARTKAREVAKPPREPWIPGSQQVYAIGDVHGRAELLRALHRQIAEDAEDAPHARRSVIYLGDYIDRGPASRAVLDILIDEPLAGFQSIHLKGNHEDMLLGFLGDPAEGPLWIYNGGDATLRSYGIEPYDYPRDADGMTAIRGDLTAVLSGPHRAFLEGLVLNHSVGGYFFVHAGVRPGVPLDAQAADDMIWIREGFLDSDFDFGKTVVHGHTPSRSVERRANRIGIDTGAFASGTLTCVVLTGTERRFLRT